MARTNGTQPQLAPSMVYDERGNAFMFDPKAGTVTPIAQVGVPGTPLQVVPSTFTAFAPSIPTAQPPLPQRPEVTANKIPGSLRKAWQTLVEGQPVEGYTPTTDEIKAVHRHLQAMGTNTQRLADYTAALYQFHTGTPVPSEQEELAGAWTPGDACPVCMAVGKKSVYAGVDRAKSHGNIKVHDFADCLHTITRTIQG